MLMLLQQQMQGLNKLHFCINLFLIFNLNIWSAETKEQLHNFTFQFQPHVNYCPPPFHRYVSYQDTVIS